MQVWIFSPDGRRRIAMDIDLADRVGEVANRAAESLALPVREGNPRCLQRLNGSILQHTLPIAHVDLRENEELDLR